MLKREGMQSMFERLVEHLVKVEEESDYVVKNYFSPANEGKYVYEELMRAYTKEIENYLAYCKEENKEIPECPFVLIGSLVEVENMHTGEVARYKIVYPFAGEGKFDFDYASCLSPIGKALLLKKVNDKITVQTPAGESCYQVISIRLPEEMYFT